MSNSRQPFDDIRHLISTMPGPDDSARDTVGAKIAAFPGPQPVMGDFESRLGWLAAWQGTDKPAIERPLIAVFAGTHDVAKQFTEQPIVQAAQARVESLTQGSASLRGMAESLNAAFKVYEMGLEYPVQDMTEGETLSEKDCAAAMAFGMEVVAEGADIIVLGNAGYGSAVAGAAIARGLYGGASEYWAGAHNDTAGARVDAVNRATARYDDSLSDPLVCLRCFGGRDIAGLAGAIIAARHQSIPVILDGFVVCAAAAVLHKIDPKATEHCIAGHLSSEPAHEALLDRMGLTPMVTSGIAVGDGTGAAFALSSLRLAAKGFASLCN